MGRERDGGREPRKEPAARLMDDREREEKPSDPMRFGPKRGPEADTSRQRCLDQ